jgi:uncharacterized protein (DUF2062 family)
MLRKCKNLLRNQLKQGASVQGLAVSVAVACVCGIFPLLGFTTVLCLAAGKVYKLNHPTMQLVNYFMAPLQLLLIPVFLRLGERLVGAEPVPFSLPKMLAEFQADPLIFLEAYGLAGAYAVFVWCLMAPALGWLVYYSIRPVLRKLLRTELTPGE